MKTIDNSVCYRFISFFPLRGKEQLTGNSSGPCVAFLNVMFVYLDVYSEVWPSEM